MSETNQPACTGLKEGLRIKERRRQETEERVWRASNEYCIHSNLFLMAFLYPKSKGKAKHFYTEIQRTNDSNHFLNSQNML